MTGKSSYYVTRTALSVVFGGLLVFMGLPWWGALLASLGMWAFFLWAPHSGRYVVRSQNGVTPLRRDERAKAIRDQAARNALVATVLTLSAVIIYFGLFAPADVPVPIVSLVLVLGMLAYFASDFWLRRS